MKSIVSLAGAVITGLVAMTGTAFAAPVLNVPEPGSIALVGVGLAAAIYVARKGRK